MTDEIAPEVAETSPEPQESPPEAIEPEAKDAPESSPEPQEPKRSRAEERITGLLGDNQALRSYGEQMRQINLSLQQQVSAVPQEPEKPDRQPTLEDFDHDPDKFAQANNAYIARQVNRQVDSKVDKAFTLREAANEEAAIEAQWQGNNSKYAAENPDYAAVLNLPVLPIALSNDMLKTIKESDDGPAIAHHLVKNPDVAAKISRMNDRQTIRAITKIERDLSSPKVKPTSAPTPPTPVGGQHPTIDLMEMPINDWMASERKRLAEKRGR
jgi:hypothetical protein